MGIIVENLRVRRTQEIKKFFADLISLNNDNHSYEVVYQSLRGNVIYEAVKHENKITGKTIVYATVTKFFFEGGKIYPKRMDESMHPCFYDAPMRLMKMLTPTHSECANAWRSEVIKRHEKKRGVQNEKSKAV